MLRVLMGRDMNNTTMSTNAPVPPRQRGEQTTMQFAARAGKGSDLDTSLGTMTSSYGEGKTLAGDDSRYNLSTLTKDAV